MQHTLEITGEGQDERYSALIEHAVSVPPCSYQDHCFCSICPRSLKDGVHVLPLDNLASRTILILLRRYLEANRSENFPKRLHGPVVPRSIKPIEDFSSQMEDSVLIGRLACQRRNLVSVCAEHIVLTAPEIRVHLTRQQRVLGNVGLPRILVQRQDQQPYDANENA